MRVSHAVWLRAEKDCGGHGRHAACPARGWNCLSRQLAHVEALVARVASDALPGAHSTHDTCPTAGWNEPGAHATHTPALDALLVLARYNCCSLSLLCLLPQFCWVKN